MDMFDFAGMLFGRAGTSQANSVTASGAAASDDGVASITLDADVTPAEDVGEDADQTVIDLPTSPDVDDGDEVIVTLVGDGPLKTPIVTANPGSGDRMRALANSAKSVADAAQAVADAINQHFFADTNGIHVTEATQEDWNTNHSGANVLINSIGQLFRDGLNNLLTLTTESGARALTIWDGLGNTAEHVVATFAGDGIGLAGDAFHLTSTKTTSQSGVEHVTSDMRMDSSNSSYKVSSYVKTNTYLSGQLSDLLGRMELGLNTGDSTFFDIYEAPNINMYATANNSSLTAAADSVSVIADDQIELVSDQYVMEGVNGTSNTWSVPAGTVLWSGTWYMTASHTANLAHNVSACPTGIVLHWQAYVSGSAANQDQCYCFVPKTHVASFAGGGVQMPLMTSGFGKVGCKYVYVYDDRVTGAANNNQSGTSSGITYNNAYWVLTQIIAV